MYSSQIRINFFVSKIAFVECQLSVKLLKLVAAGGRGWEDAPASPTPDRPHLHIQPIGSAGGLRTTYPPHSLTHKSSVIN